MRGYRVEVIALLLDHDPRFFQAVEDFLVEALIAQLAVEGSTVAVLPWTAGPDVQRPGAELCLPIGRRLSGYRTTSTCVVTILSFNPRS